MTVVLNDADGFHREDILGLTNVSRETLERITVVLSVLGQWSKTHNLIGPAERQHLWRRHVLDSVQMWKHRMNDTDNWLDMGSGSGFPGLVIGCCARESNGHVTLVESVSKKASFLRSAARKAELPVDVISDRVENVSRETVNVVSARALAALPQLLEYAFPHLDDGGRCVFLKGREVELEIQEAKKSWVFDHETHQSLSDDQGCVLVIRELKRRAT